MTQITGANGTIGYACTAYALCTGYRVRCIVRREDAIATIRSGPSVQSYLDRLEFAVVLNNEIGGAYDDAFANVDYVVHVAGVWPLPNLDPDTEIYHPFMQSMKNVLLSAETTGTVKRIVFTQAGAGLVDSEVGDAYGRGMTKVLNEHVKADAASVTYQPPLVSAHQAYCAAKAQCMDYLEQLRQSNTMPFVIVQVIPGTVIGSSDLVNTAEEARKHMDRQTRALIFDDNTPRYAFGFIHVQDCAKVHIEALDEEKVKDDDVPFAYIAAATTESGLEGEEVWSKAIRMIKEAFPAEIANGVFKVGAKRTPINMPYRVDSRLTERMLLGGQAIRGLEESARYVADWYAQLVAVEVK